MGSLSPAHWLIVLIVAALLFFGWKQLPDMARSLGRSLRIFKTEMKGMVDDDTARDDHHEAATPSSANQASEPPGAAPLPPGGNAAASPSERPSVSHPADDRSNEVPPSVPSTSPTPGATAGPRETEPGSQG